MDLWGAVKDIGSDALGAAPDILTTAIPVATTAIGGLTPIPGDELVWAAVGGAVGGVIGAGVDGNIDSFSDVVNYGLIGGAVGAGGAFGAGKLASSIATKAGKTLSDGRLTGIRAAGSGVSTHYANAFGDSNGNSEQPSSSDQRRGTVPLVAVNPTA